MINPALIFDGVGTTPEAAEHVLVVSDRGDESARLGLPVDRVLGLVDGLPRSPSRDEAPGELVVERRPVEGRLVNVLDARALVARAQRVIEDAVESSS